MPGYVAARNRLNLPQKAGRKAYRREDIGGLVQLRDRLRGRFLGGVLMYTGPQAGLVDDRVHVAPIDNLWEA